MPNVAELISLLKSELYTIHNDLNKLGIAIARLEERQIAMGGCLDDLDSLRTSISKVDRRLVKISGINGDNGKISELEMRQEKQEEKIQSLNLSRAAVAGYAVAAGGTASVLVKFLM